MEDYKKTCDLLCDNSPKAYKEYDLEADILNYQINRENVFNIGIVAKYGAGKSSVINTYLNKYRNKEIKKGKSSELNKNKYVRISLSTFNQDEYDEPAIERSILQQLLYSRRGKELPNSKIERTNKSTILDYLGLTITIILFIITLIFSIIGFSNHKLAKKLIIFEFDFLKYLYLIVCCITFGILMMLILLKKTLIAVKFKDLEVDFSNNNAANKDSKVVNLINKFMDEVLYFFECIPIDLVIFEDLDRLNNTEIFTKLRELNLIINNSYKKEKKVTFLYAVKSDVLPNEEERAKFFDFILPIVSIINPVTTISKLQEKEEQLVIQDENLKLSGKLIRGISVYIPDMRILNNTFNDYIIMHRKIISDDDNLKHLSNDKLFAICLYKNLFPFDYVNLENNHGFIPIIINMDRLLRKCVKDCDMEIEKLENEINEIEKVRIESFDALRGLIIQQIKKMPTSHSSSDYIDPWTIPTFKNLNYSKLKHPIYSSLISFSAGNQILTPNKERYEDLEQRIIEKTNNKIDEIRKEISCLEIKKDHILNWCFRKIVEEKGIDFCFDDVSFDEYNDYLKEKFKHTHETIYNTQMNYIKFLINQDFIDEHYIEYTSNYKTLLLSYSDNTLYRKIGAGISQFEDKVENFITIYRLLTDENFTKDCILIGDFLDNMNYVKSVSKAENDNKYNNLIQLLTKLDRTEVKKRLTRYINKSDPEKCNYLLSCLLENNCKTGIDLINLNEITQKRKELIVINLIKYNNDYSLLAKDDVFLKFISSYDHYLNLFAGIEIKVIFNFLSSVKLRMEKLINIKDNNIQNYIIDNNMFLINVYNLEIALSPEYKDFYHRNYSYIITTKLKDYILINLETYVKNVLLNDIISCDLEDEDNICSLLKNDTISIEYRSQLLPKVNIKIDKISDYQVELYKDLFKYKLINSSWYNIEYAYMNIDFAIIKEYLETIDFIEGEFKENSGIDALIPGKLILDILKNICYSKIEHVTKNIKDKFSIRLTNLHELEDSRLATFIKSGHVDYANDDLKLIIDLSNSLNEYLKYFELEIINNFDAFFREALPTKEYRSRPYSYQSISVPVAKKDTMKIIKNVLLCKDASTNIKSMLINKCIDVIKIEGIEKTLSSFVVDNEVPIPAKLLWLFTDCNLIDSTIKKKMYTISYTDEFNNDNNKQENSRFIKKLDEKFEKFFESNEIYVVSDVDIKVCDLICPKEKYQKEKKEEGYKYFIK